MANINLVTDNDVSAEYSSGLKIAKVGGTDIYMPNDVKMLVTVTTQDGVTVTGQTVYVHEGTSAAGPVYESQAYNGSTVEFDLPKGMQYFVRVSDSLSGHFNPTTATGYANGTTSVSLVYSDVSTMTTLADIAPALAAINNEEQARTLLVGKGFDDIWIDYDATATGDAKTKSDAGETYHATYTSNNDADGHPIWYDPWIITDVQTVEDSTGGTHLGAILMRQYCGRYDIVFDAANTEEATESTAQSGVYYYGWAAEWVSTTTYAKNDIIQYGGYIYSSVIASNVGNTPTGATDANWKLLSTTPSTYKSYSASGLTLLSLNVGDTLPTNYVKIFKNSYSDSTRNIIPNGHNRYETSAIRQYLNAGGAKDTWWTQQHVGQVKPASATNYSGYQRGCSDDILDVIKPVKRSVMSNTVCDGGATYTVCDDFFLPAVPEMYGTDNADDGDVQRIYWAELIGSGLVDVDESEEPTAVSGYSYFGLNANNALIYLTVAVGGSLPFSDYQKICKNLAPKNSDTSINAVRKMYRVNAKTSAAHVWLRSASRGYSAYAWYVYSGGPLSSGGAYTAFAPAPACVIY